MIEQIKRRDAVERVRDRFNGKPFVWGRYDCVRLAAATLRELGRPVSLVAAGGYKTEAAARAALGRAGFETLEAAVDAQGLMRIPPASAWVGDLIGLPAIEGGGLGVTLMIAVGNGRVLGFKEGRCGFMQPKFDPANPLIAWRV